MVTKVVHASGTRKRAVARATLKPGKGLIRINKMLLDVYKPVLAKNRIMEPLQLAGDIVSKVDINVNVNGGGWQAQSEATRLAIARGLLEFSGSKDLKQTFLDYDRHLIVADIRTTEPSKPNDSKPRAKRQKSYR
ncbi:30S ribosomal protein S9 [Candidatus Woesearchaeota archaeon]|nr:30S ribosomal protein S9 [Candidatus Woesearchaeota archaeon]